MEKRSVSLLLILLLVISLAAGLCACGDGGVTEADSPYGSALEKTAAYVKPQMESPGYGDEWNLIAMARSEAEGMEEVYERYYENLVAYLQENDGILDQRKYSEYSKVIVALTAIGKDPSDVGGYDLLAQLSDMDMVTLQGSNGPVWALIALDSGGYEAPKTEGQKDRQTDRDVLIADILSREIPGGGFTLSGEKADSDMTGMALQAMAPYADREDVAGFIDRALTFLSESQLETGGFATIAAGKETAESDCQVIVALTALGIDPTQDERFIKNGNNVMDALLQFALEDGGFCHTEDSTMVNGVSTEQGYYALTAYSRFVAGKSPLYQIGE